MTNERMEQRLASAVEKTAPDDVNGVLSRCEMRKGTVINMPNTKTATKKWIMAAAACLAVILVGAAVLLQQANAVATVVSLDVNPSIELKVNSSEKVLSCTPLNDDAKAILAEMGEGADLKGAKLEVAVNAIVGSLVRNGYLDSISSAIMISVEDKNTERAEKLRSELASIVDVTLQTEAAKAAVLTQTLPQDKKLEQQARENNISTGKAALINRVLTLNAGLKFEELAKLSVEELKDLAEAGAPAMPIGKEKALEIATAAYTKTTTAKLLYSEVDPELDEIPAHYEVELTSETGEEFEYKIDAYTGTVLESKREGTAGTGTSAGQPPQLPSPDQLDYAKIKAKVLKYLGLSENISCDMDVKLEIEDGKLVYEVEFKAGKLEYSFKFDATTGALLKQEIEKDD